MVFTLISLAAQKKKLDREVKAIKHDYKSNYARQKNARIKTRKNDKKYTILSDSQHHNRI